MDPLNGVPSSSDFPNLKNTDKKGRLIVETEEGTQQKTLSYKKGKHSNADINAVLKFVTNHANSNIAKASTQFLQGKIKKTDS